MISLARNFIPALLVTAVVSVLPAAGSVAHAQQPGSAAPATSPSKDLQAKMTRFFEQFGSTYTKVSEGVWTIPYQGKSLTDFRVIIATTPNSDLVVVAVVIAEKKNLKLSQDLLYKLLKYNNAADQVKVGFDNEDDLFLRAEVDGRTLDLEGFRTIVEQVAAASDQVHGQIRASLAP